MEKTNENKKLSVSERMKASEKLGAKVATIINKARAAANKILASSGYGVNINVDFYRLDDINNNKETKETQEVTNG